MDFNAIINGIPSWVGAAMISFFTSYFFLSKKVETMKTEIDAQSAKIKQLEEKKLDKEVFTEIKNGIYMRFDAVERQAAETNRRIQRIEDKLDKFFEKISRA